MPKPRQVFICRTCGAAQRRALALTLAGAMAGAMPFNPCSAQEGTRSSELVAPASPNAPQPATSPEWTPLDSCFVRCVPYIKAKVGDTEAWFMFDTGAHTCFDDSWVRAHIPDITTDPVGKAELVGRTRVTRATVTVGSESIEVKNSPCHDLRAFAGNLKPSFAGLIGGDFMATRVFRIRYSDGPLGPAGVDRARVERPTLPPAAQQIPLIVETSRLYITAIISQGSGPRLGVTATIDTGHAGTASLGPHLADRLHVRLDPGPPSTSESAYGPLTTRRARDLSIDIGALQFHDLDADVGADGTPDNWPDLLIGGRILRLYQVVLDIPHRTISLTPAAPNVWEGFSVSIVLANLPSFLNDALGIPPGPPTLVTDSWDMPVSHQVLVTEIAWGSQMFRAGIRSGDWLVAINGEETEDLGIARLTSIIKSVRTSGGEFTLRIRRGPKTFDVRVPRREPYKDPEPSKER